ncbi:MAG: hypothetical protein QXF17_05950 [Ignisphaera sp.]
MSLQRYIPIPRGIGLSNHTYVEYNLTVGYRNGVNVSMEIAPGEQQPFILPWSYLLYAFLISLIVIIAVIAVFYMSFGYRGTIARIVSGTKEGYRGVPEVTYVYTGVKAILRKYYMKLREKVQCLQCTPREIAFKIGIYGRFADVYEDVVYGCKERRDIDRVLSEVDHIDETK